MWDYLTQLGGYQIDIKIFVFGLDKIFHIITMILSGIVLYIVGKYIIKDIKRLFIIILFLLICIGIGKELFDYYIRLTIFGINDLFADTIGIIIFFSFFYLKKIYYKNNKDNNYIDK